MNSAGRRQSGPSHNAEYLSVLFDSTTSFNGASEILDAFQCCDAEPHLKGTCSFYQGCGSDLVTLACETIDVHILSDERPDCEAAIDDKLERLRKEGFIQALSHHAGEWSFIQSNRKRTVFFTTRPIDQIGFEADYGKQLGLVFEYNPGNSALVQSFWRALASQLMPNGIVVGSYTASIDAVNRDAFVFDRDGSRVLVCGFESIPVDKLSPDVVKAANEDQGQEERPVMRKLVQHSGKKFRVCYLNGCIVCADEVWKHLLSDYLLEPQHWGKLICMLRNTRRSEVATPPAARQSTHPAQAQQQRSFGFE